VNTNPASTKGGRWRWLLWVGLVVVVVVVAGVVGGVVGRAASTNTGCDATAVANQDLPAVVTLSVRKGVTGSTGSGEIIRSDGYILTNNHVISLAASGGTIEVIFSDGASASATLTGRDPKTDLAVVKVNKSSLPVLAFGSSNNVQVGQPVVAIGAPLGLSSTVTTGIVSALDRTIEVPSDNGQSALLVSAVQTDAAINPGNSGGPLTDCSGNLIGVNSAGATVPNESGESSAGSVGLNFAIPVDLAKSVSDEIIATGSVTHSYFGIQVIRVPPAAAAQAGTAEGLYVAAVVPGGPSASAGLKQGDIITTIDGQPATDSTQLEALTLTKKPGDTVKVTYERSGKSMDATITLGTQP
jgi:putative serine protease PepD